MSAHQAINAALSERLQDLGLSTAYENAPFDPPSGVYVVENYLPSNTQAVGMETGGSDSYSGIYQVTVLSPKEGYKLTGYSTAKSVAVQFSRGTELTTNEGIGVRVEQVSQSPAFFDGNRWAIPVSINFRAFAKA